MKVLILSASVGGGHLQAANAINDLVKDRKEVEIKTIDAIELSSHILNTIIVSSYKLMVKKFPQAFRLVYTSSDSDNKFSRFTKYVFSKKSKKLFHVIENFSPDILISTHPLSMEMAAYLKQVGKIKTPIINVMTDYIPHQTWIDQEVDEYIVATEDMIEPMCRLGVPKDKIRPYGIPVRENFFINEDKEILKQQLGFKLQSKIILLMAGSFGVKDVFRIYNDLIKVNQQFQIIVITGNNKKLYKKFQKKINSLIQNGIDTKKTRLIMFTDEVDKYMKVSDFLITKPGGLTISEALATNLPMGLFKPIPGQEEGNQKFLIKHSMAINIDVENRKEIFEELITDEKLLENKKDSCRKFDKSKSNNQIIDLAYELYQKQKEEMK